MCCTMVAGLLFMAGIIFYPGLAVADGEYHPDLVCVILEPGHDIEEVNGVFGTETVVAYPQMRVYLLATSGIDDLEQFTQMMSEHPAVASAEPNFFYQTPEAVRQMVIPAVGGEWEDFEDQDLTERIGLDEAHQMAQGAGVTVAILDTGVDPEHEVFQGRLSSAGIDFLDGDAQPWEMANGVDDDGDGVTDGGFGHGSMVAGIVALVAPQATLLPVRIIDDEGRTDAFLIVQGIIHALQNGAAVINMSFGVPLDSDIVDHILQQAEGIDAVAVAGAGNEDHEEPPYYPAAHDRVFMVTALDSLDVKADFADYHERVLVSAPGTGVRSAYPGNTWGLGSGCSFATPFVSGEAALILGLAPAMDWDEMESRVASSVDSIYDSPGNMPYVGKLGTGRVFLPEALYDLTSSDLALPGARAGSLRAWPNPAAGEVRLRWSPLSSDPAPWISVFDASGRLVLRLPAGGSGSTVWNGRNALGSLVPGGIYYVRLEAEGRSLTASVLVVR